MDLSIAIVSYNVRELLAECLSSVEASGWRLRQEVIVVDNASHDGSAEFVRRRFPHVRLIANTENLGFARACNQGLRVSQGRYVLLLNPDTVVVGDCLPRMVEFMDAHPDCGAATCRTWIDADREWCISNFLSTHPWRELLLSTRLIGRALTLRSVVERHWRQCWEIWLAQEPCQVEGIMGAFFLVRRRVVEEVGGLDEQFFMYYEDADWSCRIREAGWKLYLEPRIGIVHHLSQSSKASGDSLAGVYRRSQWYYLRKHFGRIPMAFVYFMATTDAYLCQLLRFLHLVNQVWPEPVRPGRTIDLADAPSRVSWPSVPGADRYLLEVSLTPLFLGGAGKFVESTDVEFPLDEFRKPGFSCAYWRVIPFRRDEPLAIPRFW